MNTHENHKKTRARARRYGRGTSDNKGPILAFIFAVRELRDACSRAGRPLPVNVAFFFEGEEENGSTGSQEVLQAHLPWFQGSRLVVISNTLWLGESRPCLTYGMRGMISLSIEARPRRLGFGTISLARCCGLTAARCPTALPLTSLAPTSLPLYLPLKCAQQISGPERDIHSGNDGGVFNEPMSDLVKLLAGLVDASCHVLIPARPAGAGGAVCGAVGAVAWAPFCPRSRDAWPPACRKPFVPSHPPSRPCP